MSYRPITDMMLLCRPKVKYYGAYPSGFLGRARAMLGVGLDDAVLHVCSGKVKDYPYDGFGKYDETFDIDPYLNPDHLGDVRKLEDWPYDDGRLWDAILADPPYTEDDADHYNYGKDVFPKVNEILRHAIKRVKVGGKVGILHYVWPQPPKNAKEIIVIGVTMGRNNKVRLLTVFEKLSKERDETESW